MGLFLLQIWDDELDTGRTLTIDLIPNVVFALTQPKGRHLSLHFRKDMEEPCIQAPCYIAKQIDDNQISLAYTKINNPDLNMNTGTLNYTFDPTDTTRPPKGIWYPEIVNAEEDRQGYPDPMDANWKDNISPSPEELIENDQPTKTGKDVMLDFFNKVRADYGY